ncbi:hypothetical protein BaRGS_00012207 [Batillaria attramentaria]|uniref:Uncharacterized protein n=1 Tax=Batillaria attramentaria TaxID=370345 RepID=A0ABD0LBD1_9CAEN
MSRTTRFVQWGGMIKESYLSFEARLLLPCRNQKPTKQGSSFFPILCGELQAKDRLLSLDRSSDTPDSESSRQHKPAMFPHRVQTTYPTRRADNHLLACSVRSRGDIGLSEIGDGCLMRVDKLSGWSLSPVWSATADGHLASAAGRRDLWRERE